MPEPHPYLTLKLALALFKKPLTLDQLEAEHIRRILASTTTIEEAATKLGIDPSTLYRKRKKYGI